MNNVNANAKPPAQDAYRRLIERLPVTLRPSLNQQLSQWTMLFPFEQNRVVTFMDGVEALSPTAFHALTGPLFALEAKMDVRHWNFSEQADTIENASLLARSAYYADWRRETEKVFETIDAAARNSAPSPTGSTRLMLLFLPASLPVDPQTVWQQWDPRGREIRISGDAGRICELALQGQPGLSAITTLLAGHGPAESSDLWLIDAEEKLNAALFFPPPRQPPLA